MAFDYSTLITDRAASDPDALKALVKKPMSQWTAEEAEAFRAATLKGSYDYTDLDRVSACMEDLVSRLNWLGYNVPGYERVEIERTSGSDTEELDPYTWYVTDNPTRTQMEQYRRNVAAVRAVLALPEGTVSVPETMRPLKPAGANAIEAVLAVVDEILNNIPAARRHCGVTVCGSKGVIA